MTLTLWLLLAGFVAATVIAIGVSAAVGSRVAALQAAPWVTRTVVVLSGLALGAAAIALALGGPGPDDECSGPVRDGVAAYIAVFAIPSIVIAALGGLGALVGSRRSTRPAAIALVTALAAAVIDWYALLSSVHICLE